MSTQITMTNAAGGILEGDFEGANVTIDCDKVLNFDGTGDYITCGTGYTNPGADDFCFSAWIKTSSSEEDYILNMYEGGGGGDRVEWRLMADGEVRLLVRDGGSSSYADSTATVNDGNWHHIVSCWDRSEANQIIHYVDGVLTPSIDTAWGIGAGASDITPADALLIGARGDISLYFTGQICDVRYYAGHLLSAAEVGKLASAMNQDNEMGSSHSALKAWWRINEGTGTSIVDYSTNSNTGTVTGTGGWIVNPEAVVNFQDGPTTMETLTLKSGTANVKALNYPLLDGAADYVDANTTAAGGLVSSHTISAWIKMTDGVNGNDAIFGTRDAANENASTLYISTGGGLSYYYGSDDGNKYAVENVASFVDGANPWKHVAATMSYTDDNNAVMKVFVNGEERALHGTNNGAFTGKDMNDYSNGIEVTLGAENNNNIPRWFLNGGMRDVKMFYYALSPEQVNSLYWGTYPVKPTFWWKMDDDSGAAGTIVNSGTAGGGGGLGVSLAWTTGTLNVKGGFIVKTNGTVT